MNKNDIKGSRKIKFLDKTYKKGDFYLHPLTLSLNKVTKDKITPTEPYYDNVKKKYSLIVEKDNLNFSDYEIQKYMSLPFLNLNYEIILNYYGINNIDNLNNLINLKINKNHPPQNIIRIINMWIKNNLQDLKNYNEYIYFLFKKFNDNYYNLKHDKNNIIQFIDKWLKSKNINDFEFNLFNDIYVFIKNNNN